MIDQKKNYWKGFFTGILSLIVFVAVLGATVVYAVGGYSQIKIYKNNIKMFVDGKLVIPTDANGKKVEPFIYNGTTYLPARALSNALTNYEKSVTWDGKTQSVYIGEKPVSGQIDIASIKHYGYFQNPIRTGKDAQFKLLDKVISPFNTFRAANFTPFYGDYLLKSNYNELNGKLVVPYEKIGSTETGKVSFYNVDQKGEETLIKEYEVEAGDEVIDVNVKLNGVKIP